MRRAPETGLAPDVSTNATAQASLYTGSDGTHPTEAGHYFDGLTQAAMLRGLILSEFD